MIELVAFLGNYGKEYARNRHNAGWLLVDHLPFSQRLSWQGKFKGRYSSLELAGEREPRRVHFLMPETYMNLSGDSVHAAATFFKVPVEAILVVHDELELPLGVGSLKFSGGLGGHNGLRSMKTRFGSADFWRLRLGIGRPNHPDIAAWVLSDFSRDEETMLDQVLPVAAAALETALARGPETLLPEWNKKRIAG